MSGPACPFRHFDVRQVPREEGGVFTVPPCEEAPQSFEEVHLIVVDRCVPYALTPGQIAALESLGAVPVTVGRGWQYPEEVGQQEPEHTLIPCPFCGAIGPAGLEICEDEEDFFEAMDSARHDGQSKIWPDEGEAQSWAEDIAERACEALGRAFGEAAWLERWLVSRLDEANYGPED